MHQIRSGQSLLVLVFLFITSPCIFSEDVDRGSPQLKILRSPEITPEELMVELESLIARSKIEKDLLSLQQKQTADRLSRVKRLLNLGHASKLQVKMAEIDLNSVNHRVSAREQFDQLLIGLSTVIKPDSFVEPPERDVVINQPEFQVRIPGLSMRVGNEDLFTARMAIKPGTIHAIKEYTSAKLKEPLAMLHRETIEDYFEQRHETLAGLSYSRQSEMDRSRLQLSTIKNLQLLEDHRFSERRRQGQRIEKYSDQLKLQEKEGNIPDRSYAGSADSFWLFGNGEAVAKTDSAVSSTTIEIAEQKANSTYAIDQANADLQRLKRRYRRLLSLRAVGLSNSAEIREEKLRYDLAAYQLMRAKAEQEVAKKELAQLKIAAGESSKMTSSISLPELDGVAGGSARQWLDWLVTEDSALDSSELLRFLKLVEERFRTAAESRSAGEKVAYEKRQATLYLKIKSLFTAERETQQDRITKSNAYLAKMREKERRKVLKLEQWALRNRSNSKSRNLSAEAMINIMVAGKEVSRAKSELAKIELAQLKTKYLFERDLLDRLKRIGRASSSYEIKRAENRVLRSKGMLLSSLRKYTIEEQQALFLKSLYESGSMSFDEKGLAITRFMPEAVKELEKLAVLKDGPDEGKILWYETLLSDSNALTTELARLVKTGHASPVEIQRETVNRKRIENGLSREKAKETAKRQALALVKSLGYEPGKELLVPLPDLSL